MALLDLLGRRWALRLIWELRDGGLTFRELQSSCDGMSSSVLNQRLGELREAGVVRVRRGEGYSLSEDGLALLEALEPLQEWARGWSERG